MQVLGDKREEEECQEEINKAMKFWAERRLDAQNKIVAILDLRFASFNPQVVDVRVRCSDLVHACLDAGGDVMEPRERR